MEPSASRPLARIAASHGRRPTGASPSRQPDERSLSPQLRGDSLACAYHAAPSQLQGRAAANKAPGLEEPQVRRSPILTTGADADCCCGGAHTAGPGADQLSKVYRKTMPSPLSSNPLAMAATGTGRQICSEHRCLPLLAWLGGRTERQRHATLAPSLFIRMATIGQIAPCRTMPIIRAVATPVPAPSSKKQAAVPAFQPR